MSTSEGSNKKEITKYTSPFRHAIEDYERDINVMEGYREQTCEYLRLATGTTLEECKEWYDITYGPGGTNEHVFPRGEFLVQNQKTQDRERKVIPMDEVIKKCEKMDVKIAPSLAFYAPEKFKKSKLAAYFQNNVRLRNIVKQEMFAAKAAKNVVLHINKKNEQNSKKTLNNAGSGGFSSPFTILFNMSSHSALTSTCRTATSYGNAANERILGGRRHYWAPGIIINHLLSVITLTDHDELEACMSKYGLHYPTIEETYEMVMHSAKSYIRNEAGMKRVKAVIANTTPIERAAFVYMGDLFHIAKHNDKFFRDFLTKMIEPVDPNFTLTDEEFNTVLSGIDGDMEIIVSQLRPDLVGIGNNFKKCKEERPEQYRQLIATCAQLQNTIGEYTCFFKNILTNKNVPVTIARMPEALRSIGVVSDTDSTMGSAQWWSDWYCGSYTTDTADKVADTMIYIVVQNIAHLMATMSKNIGVCDEKLFTYAMKNEYKYKMFGLTTKAKHYFALITSQEGTLYSDPDLELKGVALRTSNIPPVIMDEYKETVKQMSIDIAKGNKVELLPIVKRVAEIEKGIHESISKGEGTYLKTLDINSRESYKAESNYHYHRMYANTLADKYGFMPEPPYHAVRIPVNLETKTEIREWVDSIEDERLSKKYSEWFETEGRKYTQIIIPDDIVQEHGVPKELLSIIDPRRTMFAMVEPYYHILEVFGIFIMDKKRTRLLSDYYSELNIGTESDLDVLDKLIDKIDLDEGED